MRSSTKGVIVGGMTFVALTGGGAAFGNEMYYKNVVRAGRVEVEVDQSELDAIREEQIDLDYDRVVIEGTLGESCLRLVRAYMPDGDLAGTDESIIVDDLLREPGLPCGDSATEIRTDIRNLTSAESAIAQNEALYDEISDGYTENEEYEAPDIESQAGNIAMGTLVGMLAGGLAGGIAGGMTSDITVDKPRGRRN